MTETLKKHFTKIDNAAIAISSLSIGAYGLSIAQKYDNGDIFEDQVFPVMNIVGIYTLIVGIYNLVKYYRFIDAKNMSTKLTQASSIGLVISGIFMIVMSQLCQFKWQRVTKIAGGKTKAFICPCTFNPDFINPLDADGFKGPSTILTADKETIEKTPFVRTLQISSGFLIAFAVINFANLFFEVRANSLSKSDNVSSFRKRSRGELGSRRPGEIFTNRVPAEYPAANDDNEAADQVTDLAASPRFNSPREFVNRMSGNGNISDAFADSVTPPVYKSRKSNKSHRTRRTRRN